MPSEGISKYKPNELLAYRDSLKDYRDYYNTIDFAEIKGRKEGREEGRAEGLVEGRAEGRAEGEQSKAYEIARQMLADGFSIDMIAKYTKLSTEEIEQILQ
ncbi:MAG: hypothetical protein K6F33_03745 [Bacteroidales bacterium]|nr:hypothetical protein [Bacteroidales bacterium]